MPVIKHMPEHPLPAARYIGGGAWIPGLPARDLSERDTLVYYDLLIGNLNSARPLYELVQPAPAAEPAPPVPDDEPELEPDDEPDELTTPDDEPAQLRPRRKSRKE